VTTITQNVDDLHNRAGSSEVVELHGNITRNYCTDCEQDVDAARIDAAIEDGQAATCPECEGLVRPDVVWFGEMLPPDAMDRASEATTTCDVFLSVGTSTVVYPAARLPMLAKEAGAYVVEVNPDRTPISGNVDEYLAGPAGEVLPAILSALDKAA